jgi:hypothetical protein
MLNSRRNELVRLLGFIDQSLALAEEMVAQPRDGEDLEIAEELVLECRAARRQVEAELGQLS